MPRLSSIDNVIYITHKQKHIEAVNILEAMGPPSSPPITILLIVKIQKQITDIMRKINTVKLSFPAGTT